MNARVAPCHWPGVDTATLERVSQSYPGGDVTLARMTPELLRRTQTALRRARNVLDQRTTHEIIDALDATAAAWCDRGNTFRQRAIDWLEATTGYAANTLGPALTATFEVLRGPHLRDLLIRELGAEDALEHGAPSAVGRRYPVPPNSVWLIAGGAVPNAVAVPVFTALLCRSTVLVKTSTQEPVFGALLAQSIAAIDARLGACIAAGWWPRTASDLHAAAAEAADTIVVTGTDATVAAVRSRLDPATNLVAYGDRVSFIAVGRERLADTPMNLLWMQIAEAVGWYDQQGCLSPHVVYVEQGGDLSPRQAAERLADAMALYDNKAPRGPLTVEAAAALSAHVQRAEVKAVDAERAALWKSPAPGTPWAVAYDEGAAFVRAPGHRFIHVKPVYDLEDLPAILRKSAERFQAVGLEVSDDRRAPLARSFQSLGVSRVCTAATLQRPPVDWPRDGRPVLGSLVRWLQA